MKDWMLKFYDSLEDDRASYFERVLGELDNEEAHDRFGWNKDYKERQVYIWCEYEELRPLVAPLLIKLGIDIEDVLTDILMEQRQLDREATEDYHERQREYREMQGWKS